MTHEPALISQLSEARHLLSRWRLAEEMGLVPPDLIPATNELLARQVPGVPAIRLEDASLEPLGNVELSAEEAAIVSEGPPRTQIIDLFEALKKSLQETPLKGDKL